MSSDDDNEVDYDEEEFYEDEETRNNKKTTMVEPLEDPFSETVRQCIFTTILPKVLSEVERIKGNKIVNISWMLGVSGGADSVALLHAMNDVVDALKKLRGIDWDLCVCHFDHQQRGSASDADRDFVFKICAQMDVPIRIFYWNDSPANVKNGFSQEAARDWRRYFMRKTLQDRLSDLQSETEHPFQQVGLLMTAHHQDDSDETMLLKILRGVHISNLSGMPPLILDDDGLDDGVPPTFWARPMINVRKKDILNFLNRNKIPWRDDASNKSDKYLRNRVRNELIPLLSDMIGEEALQARIKNAQAQSLELREGLGRLGAKCLEQNSDTGVFYLPEDHTQFDLVFKEALFQWIVKRTNGYHPSFERMQSLYDQIQHNHKNEQWLINIGNGYDAQRVGTALCLNRMNGPAEVGTLEDVEYLIWNEVRKEDMISVDDVDLAICVPHIITQQDVRFFAVIKDNKKLSITPPWRKQHNPIPVNEFLRGQKVPIHVRRNAPTIIMRLADRSEMLVAVYVSTKEKWIVDAQFSFTLKDIPDDKRILALGLPDEEGQKNDEDGEEEIDSDEEKQRGMFLDKEGPLDEEDEVDEETTKKIDVLTKE